MCFWKAWLFSNQKHACEPWIGRCSHLRVFTRLMLKGFWCTTNFKNNFSTWGVQDYPLNLSISLSGGEEINKDCLSNGEWTGKSPQLESGLKNRSCKLQCWRRKDNSEEQLGTLDKEGEIPVPWGLSQKPRTHRVELLGTEVLIGR